MNADCTENIFKNVVLPETLPFFVDYIPAGAVIRPGLIPETKKYIVIHNTGNYNPAADARYYNGHIHAQAALGEPRKASWHFTVDDREIWQHIPVYESAWHSGDGSYGEGNYYGIGIEICVNGFPDVYSGDEYEKWLAVFSRASDNAAVLTAALMRLYGIGVDGIRQHYDFAPNKKNCPMQMRYSNAEGAFSRENGTLYNSFLQKAESLAFSASV